jgi:hypothetical protein
MLLNRITDLQNSETYIRVMNPCNLVGLITTWHHNAAQCSSLYGRFPVICVTYCILELQCCVLSIELRLRRNFVNRFDSQSEGTIPVSTVF